MSYFFKNTRRFSISLACLLLVITLAAGTFAYSVNGLPEVFLAPDDSEALSKPAGAEDDPMPDFTDAVFEDEPEEEDRLTLTNMAYNMPSSLKAVYLVPGTDFIKEKDMEASAVKAELDEATGAAAKLGMNAVVIDTTYNTDTIYETAGSVAMFPGDGIMEHAVDAARNAGLAVFARFDVSLYGDAEAVARNAGEFAAKYRLDGILTDGYTTETPDADYGEYMENGGAIGFENYLRQSAAEKVRAVTKAVHAAAPDTAVGLLADAVWANESDDENGSGTKATYRTLIDGHADTRSFVLHRFVDFVAVENFTLSSDENVPFDVVAEWWSDVAVEADMPMYIVHAANKISSENWPADMMTQQAAEISHFEAYRGSMFNTLSAMPTEEEEDQAAEPVQTTPVNTTPANNPPPVTTTPVNVQPVQPEPVQPAEYDDDEDDDDDDEEYFDSYTDDEDDDFESDIDDGDDDNGGSSGLIKEIYPTGILIAMEDDIIEVSVTARSGSDVTATINGDSFSLEEDSGSGSYVEYTGWYEVPSSDDYSSSEYQYLGGLSVKAKRNGDTETFDGAFLATSSNRIPVRVRAEQARTYPANTKDNVPIPTLYPLPAGTVDYVVSGAQKYTSARNEKFEFVTLESGVRVETKDIVKIERGPGNNNKITGMAVTSQKNSRYTYITLRMDERVAFKFAYGSSGVAIKFMNTTKTPTSKSLSSNPLFTKATWADGNTLTLNFVKKDGFMGYKAYYDTNGNLVFRFKNPPKSINGAKIAIDPGHGGSDRGAEGYNSQYPEKVITAALSKTIAEELENRGADVLLMNSAGIEGPERAQMAEKWGADMLISVHCNSSSVNPNATGTETFYFYPFSRQLAVQATARVSDSYDVDNRGAKPSYYHVTLSPQMSSIILETGFMSNQSDYSKLLKSSNHERIAEGLADSVEAAIKAAYTGVSASGSDSSASSNDDDDDDDRYPGADEEVEDIWFDEDSITLEIGKTLTLEPRIEPEDAEGAELSWKSSSSTVLSVSTTGKIKALKTGTATVTATAEDGSKKKASVKVTVVKEGSGISDEGVTLKSSDEVYEDEDDVTVHTSVPVRLKIINEDDKQVRNSDFKWKSSKTSVASVDSHGVVTGKKKGECVITATAKNIELEWDITVSTEKIKVTSIKVERDEIYLERGGTQQLVWEVLPKDATDKTIKWKSSNTRVVTVDENGLLKGINANAGKCTVTGKAENGKAEVTIEIKVVKDAIKVEEIELDTNRLEMPVGSNDVLKVSEIYPDDSTNSAVTWKSSKPSIVTVDENGKLKALKKGTAIITVTAVGNKKATDECEITVY